MKLVVKKFGGTSVADLDKIKEVAIKIQKFILENYHVVVVISAMSGVTNKLISYCREISKIDDNASCVEHDSIVSTGELVSSGLLALALQSKGVRAHSLPGWKVPIITTSRHTNALIDQVGCKKITTMLQSNITPIISGFQGVTKKGDIATIGRGGSDTTAVALAAVLNAEMCYIYTDVEGVYTADPRLVRNVNKINYLSHEESMELFSMGAKVLNARAAQIAYRYKVPIRILSTHNTKSVGTFITTNSYFRNMEYPKISSIVYNNNLSLLNFTMKNSKIMSNIINLFKKNDISIEMIHLSMYKKYNVDYIISIQDAAKVHKIFSSIDLEYNINNEICMVSALGIGLKCNSNIFHQFLHLMHHNNIHYFAILNSENKLSALVRENDKEKLVNILHDNFIEKNNETSR